MDLKNLVTFIQVAELNSFTKAGNVLGYSQSTVSFQIKQLEAELCFPLFERVNHTVVLTDKGRQVLNYAHMITKLETELKQNLNGPEESVGHIRLAMSDSLRNSMLKEHYSEFRMKNPGITLKIIAAGTEEMFRLVNHNEADALLTLDSHIYNADYVIAHEKKVSTHFVAPPENPLAMQSNLPLKKVLEQPFLLTEKGMSYRRLLDEKLAQESLEIHPILEVGDAYLIRNLVEQGIGISFLPDFITERAVNEGRLVYLDVPNFEIDIWKQLIYHRNKWLSPQLRSVLEYCAEKEF